MRYIVIVRQERIVLWCACVYISIGGHSCPFQARSAEKPWRLKESPPGLAAGGLSSFQRHS